MTDGGYRSGSTTGGKCGCVLAAFVGVPVYTILMFLSFFGYCGPTNRCHENEGWRLLGIMVLVGVVAGTVGLLTRYVVNKWRQDDAE